MNREDSIKISAKPFIFIILTFISIIFIASTANYFRMKSRFNSLVDHTKVIYQAHKDVIESMFKREEDLSNVKDILNNINSPEKDVYFVDIIRNINNKWILYDDRSSDIKKSNVSQKDIELIQKYMDLNNYKKFAFQKDLSNFYENFYKYPYFNTDFLISIIPINQDDNTVGYFVVATAKVQ